MNYPDKKVSFVFYCQEKDSVDLKIRLRYDGLKQSQFFTEILKMYTSQDPLILELVEKIKHKNKTMGIKRLKNTKKDYENAIIMQEDLGLSPCEKKELFDIIEGEIDSEYE